MTEALFFFPPHIPAQAGISVLGHEIPTVVYACENRGRY